MNRLFGKSKPKEPLPTLDDAAKSMETRGGAVDERVKKLDEELLRYKGQLSKMRPGPAKAQVQQRALRCLKQKKVYEKQRDALYGQQLNIDQAKFAQDSVRDNIQLVKAMKETQKGLKKDMKQIKIDDVEDLHDGQTADTHHSLSPSPHANLSPHSVCCAVLRGVCRHERHAGGCG